MLFVFLVLLIFGFLFQFGPFFFGYVFPVNVIDILSESGVETQGVFLEDELLSSGFVGDYRDEVGQDPIKQSHDLQISSSNEKDLSQNVLNESVISGYDESVLLETGDKDDLIFENGDIYDEELYEEIVFHDDFSKEYWDGVEENYFSE